MSELRPDVILQPRSGAEAIDLGLRMTQRDFRLLLAGQAMLILPTLLLLSLLQTPSHITILLLWWLKPLWERMSLQIFSHRLFGEPISLRQALRLWARNCLDGLAGDLLWRRPRLSRSYYLPLLLEGLDERGRRKRRRELGSCNAARWLTLFGAHLELMLAISVPLMILFFAPGVWPESAEGWFELAIQVEQNPWADHANNLLYALTLICWGPFYVGAGFSLYMNRRCAREAWDLELVFRSLARRLTAPLLVLLLLLPGLPPMAAGDELSQPATPPLCPLPLDEETPDEAPRLTGQALDSRTASRAINELLQAPPFRNQQEVIKWGKDSAGQDKSAPQLQTPGWVMQLLEMLLWGALLAGVILLLWRYRSWLLLFASRLRPQAKTLDEAEEDRILPASTALPAAELEQALRRHWREDPRQALALFYASLRQALEQQLGEPLASGLTEGDILQLAEARASRFAPFSHRLLDAWRASAYGHRTPDAGLLEELILLWRPLTRQSTGGQA